MFHPFKAFPKISEREIWGKLSVSDEKRPLVSAILSKAEEVLPFPVPQLTAGQFMEYVRNGNRSRYEADYFARRINLSSLVLAEGLEYNGRFLDKIIDYIWAIFGEPVWCVPAHTRVGGEKLPQRDPLPTIEYEIVDLFAAETGVFMAMILEIMGDELAAISPNLVARIKSEVTRRLLVSTESDLSRFGWSRGKNNWTPWICSNLLWTANTIFADDPSRFDAYVRLLMPSVDHYYDAYPEDGCCDEGPGYWNLSPPKFFLFMEGLYRASDGTVSCFNDLKFKNMCTYIVDAWVDQNRNVHFADNGGRHTLNTGLLRAMCERASVPEGIALADMLDDCTTIFPKPHSAIIPPLFDLFTNRRPDLSLPRRSFKVYPTTQQLFMKRDSLFIAVKGGHNHESHNHNDVGQFVIAKDGRFTVLDLGSATYDQKTFSKQRYDNYPQSGLSHNPLVFNGIPQEAGKGHEASLFEASGDENAFTCRMEISDCYPASLGLISYYRTLTYDGKALTVHDEWKASAPLKPTMTLLHETPEPLFNCILPKTTEPFPIHDDWLASNWGDMLYRTLITAPEATAGSLTLNFPL
ncbi:MAG: heparinase II/III family protein [Victivallales bacterium]|nr:heparinase II/III family protein [Victivallales bacterium]